MYIAPNFYIAETIDYSPTQYWLSIVLIAAFMLLLCYTHWKVYYIRRQANDGKGARKPRYVSVFPDVYASFADEGMLALEKLWNDVNENEKQEFKGAIEDMGSKISDCVENWSGVLRVRKIIEIRSGTIISSVFHVSQFALTVSARYYQH